MPHTAERSSKRRTLKCALNSGMWKRLVALAGVVLGALASEAITAAGGVRSGELRK